jgi:uncharacterized protein
MKILVMKILRVLLLASVASMSGIAAAAAQNTAAPSPEAIAVAKELVAMLSGDLISDAAGKMNAQAWPAIEQQFRRAFPQIDDTTLAELRTEFEKQLLASITEGINDAPTIYARYLTIQEMRDVQAFYRTPTGAKMVKLMPQIMGEVMGNLTPRMQGMMQRINVAFTGILRKHGFEPK